MPTPTSMSTPTSMPTTRESWTVRPVTVTPSMCGPTAPLAARIGDWTWETVTRQSGTDVMRATTPDGEPTYLAFCYVRLRGSATMHPRTPTFGDTLTVHSQAYECGAESVHTLHRLAPGTRPEPDVPLTEFFDHPRPDCLYAETFNRWLCRTRHDTNTHLATATPTGYTRSRLPRLPERHSPRQATTSARRTATLLTGTTPTSPPYTTDHPVDPARDLNAVGLVYFAAYFAAVDDAVLAHWRRLGRSDETFLRRRVVDHQLCYLGNADLGTTMRLTLRTHSLAHDDGPPRELLDVTVHDRDTGRLLAVAALDILGEDQP